MREGVVADSDVSVASVLDLDEEEGAFSDADGEESSLRGMRLRELELDAGVVGPSAVVVDERLRVGVSVCVAEPRLEGGPDAGLPRFLREDCDDCDDDNCADLCLAFDLLGDGSRDAARLGGADERGVVLLRPPIPLERLLEWRSPAALREAFDDDDADGPPGGCAVLC